MGLTANFAAVYLSAPYGGTEAVAGLTPFQEFLEGCPDNAFQRVVPGGKDFTLTERSFSILKAAPKLFIIGFFAMAVGTGLTSSLAFLRSFISTGSLAGSIHPEGFITFLKVSIAIGIYLAVSANLRYQFVAGILEERVIDPLFKVKMPNALALGLCSGLVRTINTYVGSAMTVEYLRHLGLN